MKQYAVLLALLAASISAQAVPVTSSTSTFVSTRDCIAGATECDFVSATLASDVGGPPGASNATAAMSDPSFGSTSGTAEIFGIGEALRSGSGVSNAGKRNSSNSYMLQKFTNTSSQFTTVTFSGVLEYDQDVPAANAAFDPTSPGTATIANAAIFLYSFDSPTIDVGIDAFENFLKLSGGLSAEPGFVERAAAGLQSPVNTTAAGGSVSRTVSTNVAAGETIWFYSFLQTPAANGANISATLRTSMVVPAPAGWTLVLLALFIVRARQQARA